MSSGWESRADQWLAWVRTPGVDDAYSSYREAFFALVPEPDGATLEVGCGEGRVTRDLADRGHRMTALDASPTLLGAAAALDPRSEYVLGPAEALPFADGAFGLVVAYNVLMDVADMPAAVAEAARVLAPGGAFCACVTHPLPDAGDWASDRDELIVREYRGTRTFAQTIRRSGLEMTFDGTMYALEDYARALEAAGLRIEALREPAPAAEGPEWAPWHRIPMFLMWRARA